jgi:hypothetical protein
MVLEMIRRGRLVRWSKAQRRPRVSELRAKGYSSGGPVGQLGDVVAEGRDEVNEDVVE